eukprot:gb/GECG01003584.1/.p1 GENE.gb/GECG01003584.1/~~gb/GECG01003584.1/.p1  ORF type:complete len:258 (+),score=22.04 gb/GECG01003584.1/:1-774(+)
MRSIQSRIQAHLRSKKSVARAFALRSTFKGTVAMTWGEKLPWLSDTLFGTCTVQPLRFGCCPAFSSKPGQWENREEGVRSAVLETLDIVEDDIEAVEKRLSNTNLHTVNTGDLGLIHRRLREDIVYIMQPKSASFDSIIKSRRRTPDQPQSRGSLALQPKLWAASQLDWKTFSKEIMKSIGTIETGETNTVTVLVCVPHDPDWVKEHEGKYFKEGDELADGKQVPLGCDAMLCSGTDLEGLLSRSVVNYFLSSSSLA